MKIEGSYKFSIFDTQTNLSRVIMHDNYITKLYRYYHAYDQYYETSVLYLFLIKTGSRFNNPLVLEEDFLTKNITGKTLVSGTDYVPVITLTKTSRVLNTDGCLTTFVHSTPIVGPFNFYACMAGYNSFSHIWSALNFTAIDISAAENLTVSYSILVRW